MQRSRVNTKLLKIFLLQLVLISAVTSTGVYLAAWVAENVLVKRALIGEADYFWQRYRTDAHCSLPNSLNLLGYLDDGTAASTVPEWLTALSPGMHRVPYQNQHPIVFVSEYDGRHLYLIFNEEQVSRLSFYFGTVPLTLVLLVLYALAYLAFIMAKRAISPIVRVAETMEKINAGPSGVMQVTQINFAELRHGADAETIALVDAIQGFLDRIGQFIVRERNFTRYASHELRTPLTVIKASAANLLLADLSEKCRRHVDRIQATVQEMEALLETLLLLAREDEIKA
ncbi:MAG TPA: histidine kinase dimerization/phospho-acceptor domain-containing protein, partial [Pseudomonadales bacterium]|nr:histidine kinase dimerization/phospho-acceptor domain-containing protein [Pseudomonadales bacterium]